MNRSQDLVLLPLVDIKIRMMAVRLVVIHRVVVVAVVPVFHLQHQFFPLP